VTAEDIEVVTSGVAVVLKQMLTVRDLRIAALEAKIALLETKAASGGVRWRGIWEPGVYPEGVLCTRSGSLWLAMQDTTATPGESAAWVLVVKRGRAE
jgi:hypothetical protein